MAIIPTIRCRDLQASVAFYTRVLGFERTDSEVLTEPGFCSLRFDGELLYLSSHAGDGAFGQRVVVTIDDVDELATRLRERGMEPPAHRADASPVHEGPVDQTWGTREFYVDDPDGNTIRFVQTLDPGGSKSRVTP